jgi:uncharacterized membrane protein YfcA
VGTSSAIDFGVDAGRASVYWHNHFFTTDLIPYLPAIAAAAFLGSYLGKSILGKISQETFRKIVLALILLTGLVTIVQNFLKELIVAT